MARARMRLNGPRCWILAAVFGASLVPAGAAARAPAAAQQHVAVHPGLAGHALFMTFMALNGRKPVAVDVTSGRSWPFRKTTRVPTTLGRAHAANLAARAPGWSGAHSTGIRVTAGLAAATLGVAGGLLAVSGWVQLSWAALSVAALVDLYRQVAAVRAAAPQLSLWAAAKAVLGTVTHAFAPAPAEVDRARAATLQIADQNQIGVWGALAERFGLQRAAP